MSTGSLAWVAGVAAVVLLQATLIFGHRAWLDEWQALQIATESPSLAALLENLRYEGHPPLWYLILRGLSVVLPRIWVLPVAVATIALVTQATILARAPFTGAERLLLASGELMMFEYLTLSRSLSLGVCCVVLAMALRRGRWAWLPIALLPLCDFLFGVLSLVLILLQARDWRLWWPGIALWLASGVLAAWSVRPAPDMMPALHHAGLVVDMHDWIDRLGALLVPIQSLDGAIAWNGGPPLCLGAVFGPLFLWFGWRQTHGSDRALFAGFALLTLTFSVLVYPLQVRHLSLLALLLVLLAWRRVEAGATLSRGTRLWLAVGSACGLFVAAVNFVEPFDTAYLPARYIEQHGLTDRPWLVFPESRAQGVSALTGIDFAPPELDCTISFVRWTKRHMIETPADLEAHLRRFAARHGPAYLLTDMPLPPLHGILRSIASFPAGYDAQEFHLFALDAPMPMRAVPLRQCVPHDAVSKSLKFAG